MVKNTSSYWKTKGKTKRRKKKKKNQSYIVISPIKTPKKKPKGWKKGSVFERVRHGKPVFYNIVERVVPVKKKK